MQLAYADWEAALIAATCGLIVVGTVLGNVLVCTTERYNRSYTPQTVHPEHSEVHRGHC